MILTLIFNNETWSWKMFLCIAFHESSPCGVKRIKLLDSQPFKTSNYEIHKKNKELWIKEYRPLLVSNLNGWSLILHYGKWKGLWFSCISFHKSLILLLSFLEKNILGADPLSPYWTNSQKCWRMHSKVHIYEPLFSTSLF